MARVQLVSFTLPLWRGQPKAVQKGGAATTATVIELALELIGQSRR